MIVGRIFPVGGTSKSPLGYMPEVKDESIGDLGFYTMGDEIKLKDARLTIEKYWKNKGTWRRLRNDPEGNIWAYEIR